ncbi:MAG: methyltransferase domain-containing protein [Bacteroidales bacterium]|jgi:cyclopropane fatty-acyl-phospholipid synthase-like methyltransferase|nr:methyltransferase domain-containing protein [Bacteroidales bacterium]
MQERHKNRALYFKELAITSKKFFIPYIERFYKLKPGDEVLEVGCGDGGNLLPFAERECNVLGVDISEVRINDAINYFRDAGAKGNFIASDFFKLKLNKQKKRYDLVVSNDVYEHIIDKRMFLNEIKEILNPGGVFFISFPAWQMPFGGHQQISKNKIISHLPFIHLFPNFLYRAIFKLGGEKEDFIKGMMEIKSTRTTIEQFESLIKEADYKIINRELYFINPHYETKFGLKPRILSPILARIPYIRNFFTTTCFYLLKR